MKTSESIKSAIEKMKNKNIYDNNPDKEHHFTEEEIRRLLDKYKKENKIYVPPKPLLEQVIEKHTVGDIVEAIGIEKVETYLRSKKLKKIKDNIKNK